jgi:hypothetical protein
MPKIIFLFFLILICACVSQNKYKSLQAEYKLQKYELQKYELLSQNTPVEKTEEYYDYNQLRCRKFSNNIKYHNIRTYPFRPQSGHIDFNVNCGYNISSNYTRYKKDTAAIPFLYAYSLCESSFFITHNSPGIPKFSSQVGEPTRYRFIYPTDTFWHGYCQWTVDSITQHITKGSINKDIAMQARTYKYGYDVYLQCTDCISAYKNEKGECLCSR